MGAGSARVTGRRLGRSRSRSRAAPPGWSSARSWISHVGVLVGEHTLAAYLTIAGVSLPFNLAHAAGNVVFCLLFGPVLVAALERSALRSHVTWRPAGARRARPGGGRGARGRRVRARARRGGLARRGLPARGPEPRRRLRRHEGRGVHAAVRGMGGDRIAAAGERCGGPLDRVPATDRRHRARGRGRRADDPRAAGVRERHHGRRPRPARDLRRAQRGDGSWSGLVNATAFGVLALRAAGVPRSSASLSKALRWVTARQHADGGFSFPGRTGRSDIDVTSGVVQALAAVRGRRRRQGGQGGRSRSCGASSGPTAGSADRRRRVERAEHGLRRPGTGRGRDPSGRRPPERVADRHRLHRQPHDRRRLGAVLARRRRRRRCG